MKDNNVITGRSKRKITLTSNFALYIVLLIGALSFFPALALGPIVEHLRMF